MIRGNLVENTLTLKIDITPDIKKLAVSAREPFQTMDIYADQYLYAKNINRAFLLHHTRGNSDIINLGILKNINKILQGDYKVLTIVLKGATSLRNHLYLTLASSVRIEKTKPVLNPINKTYKPWKQNRREF